MKIVSHSTNMFFIFLNYYYFDNILNFIGLLVVKMLNCLFGVFTAHTLSVFSSPACQSSVPHCNNLQQGVIPIKIDWQFCRLSATSWRPQQTTRFHKITAPWQSPRRISLQLPPPQTTTLQCRPREAAPSRPEGGRPRRRRPRGQTHSTVVCLLFWWCRLIIVPRLIAAPLCIWRFIQQVNQAAVTIQRWYRSHAKRRHADQAALKRTLASRRKVSICAPGCLYPHLWFSMGSSLSFHCYCNKRYAVLVLLFQEWEERTEAESHLEQQQQKKDEDRKRIREEKARLARLAAIQVPTSDSLLAVLAFP